MLRLWGRQIRPTQDQGMDQGIPSGVLRVASKVPGKASKVNIYVPVPQTDTGG